MWLLGAVWVMPLEQNCEDSHFRLLRTSFVYTHAHTHMKNTPSPHTHTLNLRCFMGSTATLTPVAPSDARPGVIPNAGDKQESRGVQGLSYRAGPH
jgi:hypothetical protein